MLCVKFSKKTKTLVKLQTVKTRILHNMDHYWIDCKANVKWLASRVFWSPAENSSFGYHRNDLFMTLKRESNDQPRGLKWREEKEEQECLFTAHHIWGSSWKQSKINTKKIKQNYLTKQVYLDCIQLVNWNSKHILQKYYTVPT